MNKTVLYAHGGSGNHGCEALVRTTSKLVKDRTGEYPTVISSHPEEDKKYIRDLPLDFLARGSGLTLPQHIYAKIYKCLTGSVRAYDKVEMRAIAKDTRDSLCISIGGDNYCYGDFDYYSRMNTYLLEHGNRTVLWGCSIEPELLKNNAVSHNAVSPNADAVHDAVHDAVSHNADAVHVHNAVSPNAVLQDISRYSLITARESITYDALKQARLDNVCFCPDTAFMLEPEEVELPEIFKGKVVGINVSPTVTQYEPDNGIVIENYKNLINHILTETDMNVALIPHVVWPLSDDTLPLKKLHDLYHLHDSHHDLQDLYKNRGRICLIDPMKDYNCRNLKYVISNCDFMVAARTHASIAAYSAGVPALVTGYSVKAKGIAKDIFGSYEDYICPVQSMKSGSDLSSKFQALCERKEEMRKKELEYTKNASDTINSVMGKIEL